MHLHLIFLRKRIIIIFYAKNRLILIYQFRSIDSVIETSKWIENSQLLNAISNLFNVKIRIVKRKIVLLLPVHLTVLNDVDVNHTFYI